MILKKALRLIIKSSNLTGLCLADLIKADLTDDIDQDHKVVQAAGCIPVLVRGGGKAGDEEILARTKLLMQQGIAAIVYGRNIMQNENPKIMV